MSIKLLKEYDGYAVGTLLTLPESKESDLVGKQIASVAPPQPPGMPAPERKAVPLPPPKPLTVPESLGALRAHVVSLRNQLARGSKSDIDAIGAHLTDLVAWIDAVIDDKHHNPGSIATIAIDPVAAHAADVKAEKDRVAAEKAENHA
jgi:hypothetical protein